MWYVRIMQDKLCTFFSDTKNDTNFPHARHVCIPPNSPPGVVRDPSQISDSFEPKSLVAGIAQLAEQLICNQHVPGSSPGAGSISQISSSNEPERVAAASVVKRQPRSMHRLAQAKRCPCARRKPGGPQLSPNRASSRHPLKDNIVSNQPGSTPSMPRGDGGRCVEQQIVAPTDSVESTK